MRHLIIILFLLPIVAVGQKHRSVKRQARFDDIYRETIEIMDRFCIDSNGYPDQVIQDTIFYGDKKIRAVGGFAVDRYGRKSKYKIGSWTEYFENGNIKSFGGYRMDFVWACRSARPALSYYSYKVGYWTYYYESGQTMATGVYEIKKQKVLTGISGQFAKKSAVTNQWLLYDDNWKFAVNRQKIILALDKSE